MIGIISDMKPPLVSSDRPREKLKRKGSAALTDVELMQALIGSGNAQASAVDIAKRLSAVLRSRRADASYAELSQISGLGPAKICEIISAFELSRRYLLPTVSDIIDTTAKALMQLHDIRHKKQEHFVCLTLDGANRLIARRTITIGTLTASLVHPREVFADAIADRAAAIIVAHNHPSGRAVPSAEDLRVTTRLRQTGDMVGIKLLDHLIVTASGHVSI